MGSQQGAGPGPSHRLCRVLSCPSSMGRRMDSGRNSEWPRGDFICSECQATTERALSRTRQPREPDPTAANDHSWAWEPWAPLQPLYRLPTASWCPCTVIPSNRPKADPGAATGRRAARGGARATLPPLHGFPSLCAASRSPGKVQGRAPPQGSPEPCHFHGGILHPTEISGGTHMSLPSRVAVIVC